jgi:hypothetical protein
VARYLTSARAHQGRSRGGFLKAIRASLALVGLFVSCAAPDTRKGDSTRTIKTGPTPDTAEFNVASWVTIDGETLDTISRPWRVTQKKSEMDDKTTTSLILSADHPLEPGKFMSIRCVGGRTELLVGLEGMVQSEGNSTAVRYRFDDGKPISEQWLESTDYHAIFAPNPEALARRIATAKRFRLEYEEFHGGNATVGFRTGRLAELLPQIAAACHWQTDEQKHAVVAQQHQAYVAKQQREVDKVFADAAAERQAALDAVQSADDRAKRRLREGFVGDKQDHRYVPAGCSVARAIPADSRVAFKTEEEARHAGYAPLARGCQ